MQVVAAWDLFRRLYLMPTTPGFFYHDFVPSPPFHYQAIYDTAAHARNILVAPRGFAKSVIVGTELLIFLLLTRPYYRLALTLATDKLVETRFDTIIMQLTQNPYILEDFGLQKPKRGEAIWNRHYIQLKSGARMEGFSVSGRKRGARPDFLILDDPEYDPESDSATSALVMKEKFETLLFRQIIPMLEKGSAIFWIGTMINRRSFLYHACYGGDPRFHFWNRRVLKSIEPAADETSGPALLWGGKFDREFLDIRRLEIGPSAFMAEYQNDPTSEQERVLVINEKKNEYFLENYGDEVDLLRSDEPLRYYKFSKEDRAWATVEEPVGPKFSSMFRIITFDPAKGLSQHHDYTCVAVLGFDTDNCLWVLDMWMGRAKEQVILNKLYAMGIKWLPRVLGIESSSTQIQLVDSMSTILEERRESGWFPRVMPVNYKGEKGEKSKDRRIATLEWRFPTGKIKYPAHLQHKWPISALYSQTRDFTYDMALLPHDDAIDAVAMSSFVVHNRGIQSHHSPEELTIADKIRAGQVRIAGVPIISGMNANELDRDILDAMLDRKYPKGYNDDMGKQSPRSKPIFRSRKIRLRY